MSIFTNIVHPPNEMCVQGIICLLGASKQCSVLYMRFTLINGRTNRYLSTVLLLVPSFRAVLHLLRINNQDHSEPAFAWFYYCLMYMFKGNVGPHHWWNEGEG